MGKKQRRQQNQASRAARASHDDQTVDGGILKDPGKDAQFAAQNNAMPMVQQRHNIQTVAVGSQLPWTEDGWDGRAILTWLGQYDRALDTNSDNVRCVQAVALGAHVLRGPATTSHFLRRVMAAQQKEANPTPRQTANAGVLSSVAGLIDNGEALYDDLSLAQEALHDLFIAEDDRGAKPDQVVDQMTADGDVMGVQAMDVWCSNPAELRAQANSLGPNEQLITTAYNVTVNLLLEMVMDDTPKPGSLVKADVEVNGKEVEMEIPILDPSVKPAPADLMLDLRDDRQGHQVLVFRDDSGLAWYDPEEVPRGMHVQNISGAKDLERFFHDDPTAGDYGYVHVQGKLVSQVPNVDDL